MTNRYKCNGKMEPDEHGGYVLHADYKNVYNEYEYVTEYLIQKNADNIQFIKEAMKEWEDANSKEVRQHQ